MIWDLETENENLRTVNSTLTEKCNKRKKSIEKREKYFNTQMDEIHHIHAKEITRLKVDHTVQIATVYAEVYAKRKEDALKSTISSNKKISELT